MRQQLRAIDDGVAVALFGQEQLAVMGEIQFTGVAGHHRVEMGALPARLGAEDASQPLGLFLARTERAGNLDQHIGIRQVDGKIPHFGQYQIAYLAAAKPIFVENTIPAAERVSSGETPIGISFPRFVLTYNRQGANLDYVRDYNMLGDGHYISLEAKAPRPDAGKAFIDFFLDDESMKIQADIGEFVNRRGIYPPLQDADKIKFVQMYQFGKEDFEAKKKEYQKIFLQ